MRGRGLDIGGRLDRYVARLFGLSYLSAFFLVVGFYLIVHMSSNLDDYLQPDDDGNVPSSWMVVNFYLLQVPFLYLEMSPFVTLVAGLFTASKLVRYNELVAGLNAGVSAQRMLAPVFLCSIFLAGGMFLLRELATAGIGARRDALEDHLEERRPSPRFEKLWVKDQLGRPLRILEYAPASRENPVPEIRGLSLRVRTPGGSSSLRADRALPVEPWEDGRWRLEGALRLDWDESAKRESIPEYLEGVRFTPDDIELAWKGRTEPLQLSFTEALRLLDRDPENAQLRTVLNCHASFPLAGLVLLLVGLPFVVSNQRSRSVERIGIGFLLCMLYFGLDFLSRTLGLQGQIGPVHAGWLPVVLFGSLGVVLFGTMRS